MRASVPRLERHTAADAAVAAVDSREDGLSCSVCLRGRGLATTGWQAALRRHVSDGTQAWRVDYFVGCFDRARSLRHHVARATLRFGQRGFRQRRDESDLGNKKSKLLPSSQRDSRPKPSCARVSCGAAPGTALFLLLLLLLHETGTRSQS